MSVQRLPILSQAGAVSSIAARMDRIRNEAADLARAHIADFEQAIAALVTVADDIAEGGEAYGVGVRETARRLREQLAAAALRLETLRLRNVA